MYTHTFLDAKIVELTTKVHPVAPDYSDASDDYSEASDCSGDYYSDHSDDYSD